MREWTFKIGLSLLAIFAPAHGVMTSVLVLILADCASGVWAAVKRGERISSAGLHRTMVKLLVYEVAIALGFIAQHYLLADTIPVINIVGSFIGITELTSAYENINEISGGKLLKEVIQKLKSKNDT